MKIALLQTPVTADKAENLRTAAAAADRAAVRRFSAVSAVTGI